MNSHNQVEAVFEKPAELSGFQLYLLLTAIAMAAFLTSLDGFIVNVAIPTISGELGVREDVGTWIITIFSTASTICASTLALADIYYLFAWLFVALCVIVLFYKRPAT